MPCEKNGVPIAMTVAGSDSGGGAGIQADLKTFTAVGVFGTTVITAITAQNTKRVSAVQMVDPEVIAAQMDAVSEDLHPIAAKTGMLGTSSIISTVCEKIEGIKLAYLVVDPVMISKSGHHLLEREAMSAVREKLVRLATVVTPNAPEAAALTGMKVSGREDAKKALKLLHDMGAAWVVVKGGHLPAVRARDCGFRPLESPGEGRFEDVKLSVDYIYDGKVFRELGTEASSNKNTHGTGCVFSAAITAFLALGLCPLEAIINAKRFVAGAIVGGLPIGAGVGPANPMALIRREKMQVPIYERVD